MPPSITEDDYLAWRAHPVTRWVMEGTLKAAEAQKAEWLQTSWRSEKPDGDALLVLHTRADAYLALIETDYERWSEINATADA